LCLLCSRSKTKSTWKTGCSFLSSLKEKPAAG
jgi:hypothetical protein